MRYRLTVQDSQGKSIFTIPETNVSLSFASLLKEEILPKLLKWSDKDERAFYWDNVTISVHRD